MRQRGFACMLASSNSVLKMPCLAVGGGIRRTSSALARPESPQGGRHKWTPEQDARLKDLVAARGNAWKSIAGELEIQGSPSKVRRRWETLQPSNANMWTKAEDTDLARAIQEYTAEGHALGDYGSWVAVSGKLKTRRTPRQCFSRWTLTLMPRQGKALPFTRFESISAWRWSEDERRKLKAAVAGIELAQEDPAAFNMTQKLEPWLLIEYDPNGQLLPHYWSFIASRVGTRTAAQCKAKWQLLSGPAKQAPMCLDETKRLVSLVKTYGSSWEMLVARFFPTRTPRDIQYTYALWTRTEKKFGVDLLTIDPFSMIQDYDGMTALRPTGSNGEYSADGPLVRIRLHGRPSVLTPYYLALLKLKPSRQPRTDIARSIGLASRGSTRMLSNELIDKVVAAISLHKNDWVSISRDVGLPIHTCRKYAEGLADKLVSIQHAISDQDLDRLAKSAQRQNVADK